jgi:hypothetical protein
MQEHKINQELNNATLFRGSFFRLPKSGVLVGGLCRGVFLPPDGHGRGKCAFSHGKLSPLTLF